MACDACKARRTKCTGGQVCAACQKSGLACTYHYIAKRKGPKGWVMSTLRAETERLQNGDQRPSLPHQARSDSLGESTIGLSSTGSTGSVGITTTTGAAASTSTSIPSWTTVSTAPGTLPQRQGSLHEGFGAPSLQRDRSASLRTDSESPHSQAPQPGAALGSIDHMLASTSSVPGASNAFSGVLDDAGNLLPEPPASLDFLGSLGNTFFPGGAPQPSSDAGASPLSLPLWTLGAFQLSVPQQQAPMSLQIAPPSEPPSLSWLRLSFQPVIAPLLNIYFERSHPTIPFFEKDWFYGRIERGEHLVNPDFAALILAMASFALVQPIKSTDANCAVEDRATQAVDLLDEALKLRSRVLFGEKLSIEDCLVSFFASNILSSLQHVESSYYRLKECLAMAETLGLGNPKDRTKTGSIPEPDDPQVKDMRLRTYLILGVTERGFALHRNRPIVLRGRLSLTPPHVFDTPVHMTGHDNEPIGLQGLRRLVRLFDVIDEDVLACWNRACKNNATCRLRNPEAAVAIHRELCSDFVEGIGHRMSPIQKADILITQQWLRNRIWQLIFAHGLSDMNLQYPELRIEYPFEIAQRTVIICYESSQASLEPHGFGMCEKLYDIAMTVVFVLSLCPQLANDPIVSNTTSTTSLDTLSQLARVVSQWRRGKNPYEKPLTSAIEKLKHELWAATHGGPPS